jgi:hypothetical protein
VLATKRLRCAEHNVRRCPIINVNGQTVQINNERLGEFGYKPLALFPCEKRIQGFMPPECRDNPLSPPAIRSESSCAFCASSSGKAPGQDYRSIENKTGHGLLSWISSLIDRPPEERPCRFPNVPKRRAAAATDSATGLSS